MTTPRAPRGLGTRGARLWKDLHELAEFNPAETVLVEEACRIADRLDKLDLLLTGELENWIDLREMKGHPDAVEVHIDAAMSEARQQANVLKQLIAALRIPDEKSGVRPQQRGGARGAYKPSGKAGVGLASVTALDRAAKRRTEGA